MQQFIINEIVVRAKRFCTLCVIRIKIQYKQQIIDIYMKLKLVTDF